MIGDPAGEKPIRALYGSISIVACCCNFVAAGQDRQPRLASRGRGAQLTPTPAATRCVGSRAAEARTMRARSICFRGWLRSPLIACSRSRSAALTITHTV